MSWFSTAQAVWAGYAGAGERGRRPRRFGAARFDLCTNRDGRISENATAVMDRESPIAHAPTGGGQQSPAAHLELKGELARCGIEVPGYRRSSVTQGNFSCPVGSLRNSPTISERSSTGTASFQYFLKSGSAPLMISQSTRMICSGHSSRRPVISMGESVLRVKRARISSLITAGRRRIHARR